MDLLTQAQRTTVDFKSMTLTLQSLAENAASQFQAEPAQNYGNGSPR
jgi:hypothetical protein